jgi:hypothetical protein
MVNAPDSRGKGTAASTAVVVALCVVACSHVPRKASTEALVRQLTPALRLMFDSPSPSPSAPHALRRFTFVSEPPNEWPYGTGFAVADRTSGEVLWVYLHNGDYAPHEIRWADFDGDGRDDIFFHAGSEDVFTTHLYVNRVASTRYGVSHFAQAYANDDVYAVVVDFDADDRPELIVPETYPSEDDPCAATFQAVAASNHEWKEEYRQLAGHFDTFNFQFGASAAEYGVLQLFSKLTIVSFGRKPSSGAVVRHLRLRRNVITASLPALSTPCRARAEQIDRHVVDLIQQYEGG